MAVLIVRDIRDEHLGKLTFDFVDEQVEKERLEVLIAQENEERRQKNLLMKQQQQQDDRINATKPFSQQ